MYVCIVVGVDARRTTQRRGCDYDDARQNNQEQRGLGVVCKKLFTLLFND